MFVPLNWMVLFLVIMIAVVVIIIYEINSKFKWKMLNDEKENEIQKLKLSSANPETLKTELSSVLKDVHEKLTARQYQIFIFTAEGFSSKEISEMLHISSVTIDSHIREISKILNVSKRSQFADVIFLRLKEKFNIKSLSEISF